MKLLNKKTGIVGELHYEPDKDYHFTVATDDPAKIRIYRTLAKLNEEWKDYKFEPLIEKKFRKIIREWAKVNGYTRLIYNKTRDCLHSPYCAIVCITFFRFDVFEKLEDGKSYDIVQLVGEENKDESTE